MQFAWPSRTILTWRLHATICRSRTWISSEPKLGAHFGESTPELYRERREAEWEASARAPRERAQAARLAVQVARVQAPRVLCNPPWVLEQPSRRTTPPST